MSWIFRIWIFMPQLRRITLKLCQVALRIKHSVFIIYLLEDEQELSLGMLIRLQRIYNFWLLHAILSSVFDIIWLYFSLLYYFWTNLLTGGPAQNCCFFPISEFRRKRISNRVQMEWNLRECDFRNERDPEDLDPTSRHQPGRHEVGGATMPPPGAPSTLVGPLLLHRRTSSSYIYLRTPKLLDTEPKT